MARMATANLGFGGPGMRADRAGLGSWLGRLVQEDVAVLMLQEMPTDEGWAHEISDAGYQLIAGHGPQYRCQSGVAVREPLAAHPVVLPTSAYHGSYLAAADVHFAMGEVRCISVHASPSPITAKDLTLWNASPVRLRSGAPGEPPVWDSDHVLATVAALILDPPIGDRSGRVDGSDRGWW